MTRNAIPIPFDPDAATEASSARVSERFKGLIQSPLRAALLRYLHLHPTDAFDLDRLVQAFGKLRADVEACLRQLVEHDVARAVAGSPPRYTAHEPIESAMREALHAFVSSPSAGRVLEPTISERRFQEMVGRDEKMLIIFESIRTVAKTDLSVLVLGPTGSGKEVVARLVHELSRRRFERFQAVNCAALPDTLFESELFGYERGAFTGAYERKPGRIELANNGTLFLDEIGDLAMSSQAKLLRVVEERRVERLGGRNPTPVDFRLICATHRPLDTFVNDGRFREDLFYRVNAFTIRLPSLRERPVDIPVLAERFLEAYCVAHELGADGKRLTPGAVERLMAYPWPGNIRELEATVMRAAVASGGTTVDAADIEFLHPGAQPLPSPSPSPLRSLRTVEREHIQRVLDAVGWNKKRAASVLEIGRETLYRKIDEFGLGPGGAAPSHAKRAARTPAAVPDVP